MMRFSPARPFSLASYRSRYFDTDRKPGLLDWHGSCLRQPLHRMPRDLQPCVERILPSRRSRRQWLSPGLDYSSATSQQPELSSVLTTPPVQGSRFHSKLSRQLLYPSATASWSENPRQLSDWPRLTC